MLQQLHLTELCSKCWVHTRVHTAALLRLIIGERETNSNAGSARVRLFFDLFDLIYLFICFFSQNFSPVVKRDKVPRRETTVCLSRVGKFEQSASERKGWFTWKVDVRWCRRFVPFTLPPPSTCKGAGLGGFFFSFPFLLIAFVSPVSIVGSRAASFACQIKSNPLQSIQQLSW